MKTTMAFGQWVVAIVLLLLGLLVGGCSDNENGAAAAAAPQAQTPAAPPVAAMPASPPAPSRVAELEAEVARLTQDLADYREAAIELLAEKEAALEATSQDLVERQAAIEGLQASLGQSNTLLYTTAVVLALLVLWQARRPVLGFATGVAARGGVRRRLGQWFSPPEKAPAEVAQPKPVVVVEPVAGEEVIEVENLADLVEDDDEQ